MRLPSFKKVLLTVLFLGFILVPNASANYKDVPESSPYFPAINFYEKYKVLSPGENFYPDKPIKRVEFLKVLLGKLDPPEDVSYIKIPYQDVKESDWYAEIIKIALKKQIISGSKNFYPNDAISWLDALKYTYGYFKNVTLPLVAPKTDQFQDLHNVGPQSYFVIEQALTDHLFTPINSSYLGLFRPFSRAEGVNLVYQAKTLYQHVSDPTVSLDAYLFNRNVDPNLKDIFVQVYQILHERYLNKNDIDANKLVYGAIEGMVNSLQDPYSEFFDPEQASEFFSDLKGSVEGGIGAQVEMVGDQLHVISPLKDSPADKAGLLPEDIIISIDGTPVKGLSLSDAIKKIRGPKGSTVKLEVQRKGSSSLITISIVRDTIQLKSVIYKSLRNNIAYFNIPQFLLTLPQDFTQSYQDNVKSTPNGIILDLRNDPGGYLDAAIGFLDNFLKPGEIAVRIRDDQGTEEIGTRGEGKLWSIPMVVLVNKGSASASEITSAALKDYKRATIIGNTTFGKGLVQTSFSFVNGSALKLTIQEWLPPLSGTINKKGVTPDIEVQNDPNDKNNDAQLEKAIEFLSQTPQS